jgi:hypothetical protein
MSTQLSAQSDEIEFHHLLKQDMLPPVSELSDELKARLELEIKVALDTIEDPVVREVLQNIFTEVLRVFNRLSLIQQKLNELDTLLENLSILEMLQFEVRFLIEFIEARAMYTPGLSQRLLETFDGISYGMSHDVKRVFERELTSDIRNKSIPVVYGKILHSHGLLSNCFQQTFITLLQVLNPKLDPLDLFDDFEERLRQSLLLCNELSSLMRIVKQAELQPEPDILQKVVEKSLEFRDGSMQYLMYRDWRGYEHHSLALITSIESNLDSKSLLHQFGCYLEVLYGHVKMRAVIRDLFPKSAEDDESEGGVETQLLPATN